MKGLSSALSSAWPYATALCCLFLVSVVTDGHDWPWLALDGIFAVIYFFIAHHSWEEWHDHDR